MSWSKQGYFATEYSGGKKVWNSESGNTETEYLDNELFFSAGEEHYTIYPEYVRVESFDTYSGGQEVLGVGKKTEVHYGPWDINWNGFLEGELTLEEVQNELKAFHGLPVYATKYGGVNEFNSHENWELKYEKGFTLFAVNREDFPKTEELP